MAENDDITWRYSNGASRSDPENSIGGAATTTVVHEFEGTSTANTAAGHNRLQDTGRNGDGAGAHDGKYLMIVTGPDDNHLFVSRIDEFFDSPAVFQLENPIPDAVTSGDVYRIFTGEDLFDDVTAAECAAGSTKYRAIYAHQASGAAITDCAVYLKLIDHGPTIFEVKADNNNGILTLLADEDTGPADDNLYNGDRFSSPIQFAEADHDQPAFDIAASSLSFGTGQSVGSYVKRTTPANSVSKDHVVGLLVIEGTSSSPAQQVRTGCVLAFALDGFTPSITLQRDRIVRIKGGARYTATVEAVETGLPVPEIDIAWSLSPLTGLGSLEVEDAPQTDVNGKAGATYTSPVNPALDGEIPNEALNTAGFPATSTVANIPIDPAFNLVVVDDQGATLIEDTDYTVVRSTGVITWLGAEPTAESGYTASYFYSGVSVEVRV